VQAEAIRIDCRSIRFRKSSNHRIVSGHLSISQGDKGLRPWDVRRRCRARDAAETQRDVSVSEETSLRRKSSVKAERRADMIDQILDAAEFLFSRNGLHGVTLKDVAQRIGVHHTLINYYFEDKKKLFDAVFARRAVITSERRMRLLDEYDMATAGKPSVEGALRVFLDSDLDLYIEGGEGWRSYGALGAQVANTPEWGAEMMDQHFDPVVLRLIALLRKALPDCAEEDIFWGYHFVTGALMLTLARTGRIDKLSAGLCQSDDYVAVKERMATFMAAGFLAVCERRKAERRNGRKGLASGDIL
jgi:AcrR family transcriptional regulator